MNKTDDQIIKKFREILRRLEREIYIQSNESCCCGNGITLAQCHTLLEIESKKKESVSELAKSLGLDKSTISRTIDGLVNIGLVDRKIPAENRRMSILSLTKEGEEVCCSINGNNDKYYYEVLSVLTGPEKKELISLFEKITGRMVQLRSTCDSSNKD